MSESGTVVQVTAANIEAAARPSSTEDPFSLAILDAVPGASRVSIDHRAIRLATEDGHLFTYLTPVEVEQAIYQFDDGRRIDPFSFVLAEPIATVTPDGTHSLTVTREAIEAASAGITTPCIVAEAIKRECEGER